MIMQHNQVYRIEYVYDGSGSAEFELCVTEQKCVIVW